MMKISACLSWLVLLVGLVTLSGQVTAADLSAAELYHQYCSVCHGDKGDGRSRANQGLVPPPRDFTTKEYGASTSRETMVQIVLHGKPGTAMTAWKSRLNREQAGSIVDFVRGNFMTISTREKTTGEYLYAENCSVCHGDKGAGSVWVSATLNPPPRDFSKARMPRDRMLAAVAAGKPGTSMPAFSSQLSGQQIASVVDFIRTQMMPQQLSAKGVGQGAEERGSTKKISGNFNLGQAFYLANCSTCHGIDGDGNGPRAYFIFPKPRNFLADAVRRKFDRSSLFDAIKLGVPGREMPAWGKVIDDSQIANVTEYVYQAFILGEQTTP